jgi:hypothetical protein
MLGHNFYLFSRDSIAYSLNKISFSVAFRQYLTYNPHLANICVKCVEVFMPQLHFYVPEQVAERVRLEANAAGLTISQYLAELVKRELHPGWPEGFFEEVVGGWQGEPLQRGEQGNYEDRDPLQFGGG